MKFLQKKATIELPTIETLQEVLAILRAMYWNYNTLHWQTKGENYYGNHLLFQRLYEALPVEFDTIAEKIVAYFGNEAVEPQNILEKTKNWLDKWSHTNDLIERAIQSEQDLQILLQSVYNTLNNRDDISLGLDDFLMATANSHETNLYLLQQIKK